MALIMRTYHAVRTCFAITLVMARPALAQTDYYNTDRGRPVQIEDAYVTERYNLELKLAPLRLELPRGGGASLGVEPELAYGLLPRTQVEVGLPFGTTTVNGARRSGVAGLSLSVMHNLNAETEHWPALALRADLLAPVGALARERAATSLTGLLTRSFTWGRIHANSQYTFGSGGLGTTTTAAGAMESRGGVEISRWITGVAVDHTLPLRSVLLTAEVYGRAPLDANERVDYTTGAGVRYQATPMLALDAGTGRRLNGAGEGWYLTFGTAYSCGLRRLFPGGDWGAPAP
jgi:hypothetical protein